MSSTSPPFPVNRRFLTIATAGHVDHGKTSLLRALTGIDPDRLKEEKERQMTTDLGFAYLELTKNLTVGFVDVPGHGKFLKNMLAGVGGIDLALLVVAADEGPMPQTVQHLRILSLLGVKRVVVALTKIDLPVESERQSSVHKRIEQLLAEHDVSMEALVAVSARSGSGLDALRGVLLDAGAAPLVRDTAGGVCLPVDRVFSKAGFGTVVTGTLVRGKLSTGDAIVVGPEGVGGRVRRLESFGRTVDEAVAGQRVACNIVTKEDVDIRRGSVLTASLPGGGRQLIVSLKESPVAENGRALAEIEGQPLRLYHGSAEYSGQMRWVRAASGSLEESAAKVVALLALNEQAVVWPGDNFVLRLSDESLLGGQMLFTARPKWLKHADLLRVCDLLLCGDQAGATLALVDAAPQKMLKPDVLEMIFSPDVRNRLVSELIDRGQLQWLSESLLTPQTYKSLVERLQDTVKAVFTEQRSIGVEVDSVPLELVRTISGLKLDRAAFIALIEGQQKDGTIVRDGDRLKLSDSPGKESSTATKDPLRAKIEQILSQHLCLEVAALAQSVNVGVPVVKNALAAMAKEGEAYLVAYDFAVSGSNLQRAHRALSNIWREHNEISPAHVRDALETSRKYAMALLQYFDDNKITRRLADRRVLLREPGD